MYIFLMSLLNISATAIVNAGNLTGKISGQLCHILRGNGQAAAGKVGGMRYQLEVATMLFSVALALALVI